MSQDIQRLATDPVCGMTVETDKAVAADLRADVSGISYYFCGKGCKLEFADDPVKYLDPSYKPSR